MAIDLSKGGRVDLAKSNGNPLIHFLAGLGWDAKTSGANGADFDADVSVFMIDENGKTNPGGNGFIFYKNLNSACGSIVHQGDNRTGEGDGDDEKINFDVSKVPANIKKLVIVTTIHEAQNRNQNFGMMENAYVRIVDESTGEELIKYDMSEDWSSGTAGIVGEIYRHENGWKFKAVGESFVGGLSQICGNYGLEAA